MAKGTKPRLKELAASLGLSVTTVSRALAGYSDVSPVTRDKVAAEARRVGYVPSRVGRMLVSGRTNVVAMTLPVGDGRMIDAFLGEFVAGLGEGLAERGLDLIIAAVPKSRTDVEVLTHLIQGSRADAVVINRTQVDDARVRFLLDRQFPFIAHGRVLAEKRPYPWFDTDGEGAFHEAAKMLISDGHTRFGLLTIDQPLTFARLREDGLRRGLAEAGLSLDSEAVVTCRLGDEGSVAAAAKRFLELDPRPTAILGVVDTLAIAVLAAAAEAGIAVPEALSVIGFDDIPVASYANPPLTTFDQGARRNAEVLADMLATLLSEGPGAVSPQLLQPRLVSRASHGAAPPRAAS